MLDGYVRSRIDPAIDRVAGGLARRGVRANQLTVAGLLVGLAAASAIAAGLLWWGLALVLFSRLLDGLDGAVARQTQPTDLGGFLDIVFDYVFYGAIPLAFALFDPDANALAAAVLLFAFYTNGASFLAYAIIAEKRKVTTRRRGRKAFYFTTGVAEGTETIVTFALFCLFPTWFPVIALVFAALTVWTCAFRIREALAAFGGT